MNLSTVKWAQNTTPKPTIRSVNMSKNTSQDVQIINTDLPVFCTAHPSTQTPNPMLYNAF